MSGIAYASLLTGHQAPVHGAFTHPRSLPESLYDITEAFSDGGYDVFYWWGHGMAGPAYKYAQGVPREHVVKEGLRSDDDLLKTILRRLSEDKEYRAFILTTFSVTHAPYSRGSVESFCSDYPDECSVFEELQSQRFDFFVDLYHRLDRTRPLRYGYPETVKEAGLGSEEIATLSRVIELLYKSRVRYLDHMFGRMIRKIKAAGLSKAALVAFTADHGETLFDEKAPFKWSHAHTVRADVLDVPLVIGLPGVETLPRYEGLSRSIDVFPTLAGLVGLQLPEGEEFEGVDLSPAMRGETEAPALVALSHSGAVPYSFLSSSDLNLGHVRLALYPKSDMAFTWVAARAADRVWKLKNTGSGFAFQSFDLAADPHERNDIFDPANPRDQEMAQRLESYKARLITATESWPLQPPDAEALHLLRSLGYVQ
jgi:arylsulfatase A-like enzyme